MEEFLKWDELSRPGAGCWVILDAGGNLLGWENKEAPQLGFQILVWQAEKDMKSFIARDAAARTGTPTRWTVPELLDWARRENICWAAMNVTTNGPGTYHSLYLPSLAENVERIAAPTAPRWGEFSNN